jgi:hypothetical protein
MDEGAKAETGLTDNIPSVQQAVQNLPTYCPGKANASMVRLKLTTLLNVCFSGQSHDEYISSVLGHYKAFRGQNLEIVLATNGVQTMSICPFCFDIIAGGHGLHFRVLGIKPLTVEWVKDGKEDEERENLQRWRENRTAVEKLVKDCRSRTVHEFRKKWESFPLKKAMDLVQQDAMGQAWEAQVSTVNLALRTGQSAESD